MKFFEPRKDLLFVKSTIETPEILKDLLKIRNKSTTCYIKEKVNFFDDSVSAETLLSKKNCSLFMQYVSSKGKNHAKKIKANSISKLEEVKNNENEKKVASLMPLQKLVIGRYFNGEILDLLELDIKNYKSINDYLKEKISNSVFDLNIGYFTVFVGIKNNRIVNLLTDIFSQKSNETCLDFINYVLIIKQLNDENKECDKIRIEISLNKINSNGLLPVGPFLEIEIVRSWFCESDTFDKACSRENAKKIKNVSINEMKDKIGTLHMEKQDLRDVKLRKGKNYKRIESKNENEIE